MVNGSNHYRLLSLYSPLVRGFTQRMVSMKYDSLDSEMRARIDFLVSHPITMKDVERFPKGTKFLKRSKDGVWKTIVSKGKNHEI